MKFTGIYRMATAPDFADAAPMARALIEAAPDRLIWGSDYPHLSFADKVGSVQLFNLLADWAPDEATRRRILVDNPAAVRRILTASRRPRQRRVPNARPCHPFSRQASGQSFCAVRPEGWRREKELGSNGLLSWSVQKPTWECDWDATAALDFQEKLASAIPRQRVGYRTCSAYTG